ADEDDDRILQRIQAATEALGEAPCLLFRPELQVEGRHRQQPDTGITEIDVTALEALPGLLELAEAVAGLDPALQSPKASGKRRGALGGPPQPPGCPDCMEAGTRRAAGGH